MSDLNNIKEILINFNLIEEGADLGYQDALALLEELEKDLQKEPEAWVEPEGVKPWKN